MPFDRIADSGLVWGQVGMSAFCAQIFGARFIPANQRLALKSNIIHFNWATITLLVP